MADMQGTDNEDVAQQAQRGRQQIEAAILRLLDKSAGGLTNAEIARELGLETGMKTGQKNYLTWSILKEMAQGGTIGTSPKPPGRTGVLYVAPKS